ncbi:MAG TPA: hypothetical protein VIY51_22685 [Xanthobacteraceae bacterium]
MLTAPTQAPVGTGTSRGRDGARRKTTPLYVVCSPQRSVGKTLLARLLAEFYLIDGRPVAAFDLADEGPQLADFLPRCTTVADIGDAPGQMALFDQIIADRQATKVIDVSHRTFKDFFTIAEKIGFFEEARRQAIEPLILFMIDPGPKSAKAYTILRRWFSQASLLPVRNQLVAKGIPYCAAFPNESAVSVSLEIPVLPASLKPLIEQQSFTFAEFWRATPTALPPRLDDELRAWIKRVFLQFREIELWLICEEIMSSLK